MGIEWLPTDVLAVGDTNRELDMKGMPSLITVVLLAAVLSAGCTSRTGTGTGTVTRVDAQPASSSVVAGSGASGASAGQRETEDAASSGN
jgi:hypothetical protein